jgi:TolA-binding protein
MNAFSSTVNEVRETFDSQLEVVKELKRIDVANIAKYNIDVMQQLQNSFKKLQDLATYLDKMNGFIGNTRELNLAVNQQLQKVGELSSIIERFDTNAGTISDNSTYLKSHFKNIDNREQAINDRIADFDSNTGKMIDNLETSFSKRLKEFNDKDVDISSGFEKLFEDLRNKTREVFDDESSNIKAIKEDVNNLKGISSELTGLNQKVSKQDSTIRELLDILKDKPFQMKQPKIITIGSIVLVSIVTITCAGILYKLFFN